MKIVAALTDPTLAAGAEAQGADLVELRLDLMDRDPSRILRQYREECTLPVIATIRSGSEGGQFFGDADGWMAKIRPVLRDADYIDVEQQLASHAPEIRAAGTKIIASHHTGEMPPLFSLFALARDLRSYGDIPKIIVTNGEREQQHHHPLAAASDGQTHQFVGKHGTSSERRRSLR